MIRNALFAGLLAFGAAGAAQASDVRISGGGDNQTIEYIGPAPHENVLGGAVATVTGGGSNAEYSAQRVETTQAGRDVRLVGGGDNASLVVRQPAGAQPRG